MNLPLIHMKYEYYDIKETVSLALTIIKSS